MKDGHEENTGFVANARRFALAGTVAVALAVSPALDQDVEAYAHPEIVMTGQDPCEVNAGPCLATREEFWRGGRSVVVSMVARNAITFCGEVFKKSASERFVIRKTKEPVTARGLERTEKRIQAELFKKVDIQDGAFPPCASA